MRWVPNGGSDVGGGSGSGGVVGVVGVGSSAGSGAGSGASSSSVGAAGGVGRRWRAAPSYGGRARLVLEFRGHAAALEKKKNSALNSGNTILGENIGE